jgi:hypothetical protein
MSFLMPLLLVQGGFIGFVLLLAGLTAIPWPGLLLLLSVVLFMTRETY